MTSFTTGSEDVKAAAAHCFGNVALGNLGVYLPVIMDELKHEGKKYLVLSALKLVCTQGCITPEILDKMVVPIYDQLVPDSDNKEEGVRNMVAECFGMKREIFTVL
jgi:cullin-associated NEDD8-dissociated protein 1